jgi:hypothetical protein
MTQLPAAPTLTVRLRDGAVGEWQAVDGGARNVFRPVRARYYFKKDRPNLRATFLPTGALLVEWDGGSDTFGPGAWSQVEER